MTDGARARFWNGLGERRRADLAASPGWEKQLDAALAQPPVAWNASWLTGEEFAAHLAACLEADGHDVASWWDHLRAADLYLAAACARGVGAAIQRFESLYGGEIARTASRFERRGLAAEDLQQQLRRKLFTADAGGGGGGGGGDDGGGGARASPRIASYTGQGFLQNWVRVTATRAFIDVVRAQGDAPEEPIASELLAMLPEPGADPELQLLKQQHLSHFKAAFAEAVAALDASDRLVLRQHLVERLTIDQIGALYHLHRATAARRLVRAREALLAATRAALARRLGLAPAQLDSVLDLIVSRLEASVERLLGQP